MHLLYLHFIFVRAMKTPLYSHEPQCIYVAWHVEQVSAEKNELKEENSALESQVEKLQSEIQARVAHSKPDLNVPPPEFHQPELASHFPGDSYGLSAVDPALQQASAVLVVPIHSDLQTYSTPDSAHHPTKPGTNVSKPHARYPTSADSWPSQLLGESICSSGNNAPNSMWS